MSFIVTDVEATCWAPGSTYRRDQMEIIEIGAVMLDGDLQVVSEFNSFVRPMVHAQLSDFCTSLTSIQQSQVDAADPFAQVYWRFVDWVGGDESSFCSWGYYDVAQFRTDCERAGVPFPEWIEDSHINLKQRFASWQEVRRCGMAKALDHLGMEVEGTHHRGIDDARNIARIAQRMLRSSAG